MSNNPLALRFGSCLAVFAPKMYLDFTILFIGTEQPYCSLKFLPVIVCLA